MVPNLHSKCPLQLASKGSSPSHDLLKQWSLCCLHFLISHSLFSALPSGYQPHHPLETAWVKATTHMLRSQIQRSMLGAGFCSIPSQAHPLLPEALLPLSFLDFPHHLKDHSNAASSVLTTRTPKPLLFQGDLLHSHRLFQSTQRLILPKFLTRDFQAGPSLHSRAPLGDSSQIRTGLCSDL